MDKRFEKVLHKPANINNQYTHKMVNLNYNLRNTNSNHSEMISHLQDEKIKSDGINGTLTYCWRECKWE